MKKFLALFFSVILVAFLATSFSSHEKKAIDKDVGYSLTIDQNVPQTVFIAPAIVSDYQVARGVSVPDKGLIISATATICEYSNYQVFDIANKSPIWQRVILTNTYNVNSRYKIVANHLRGVNTRLDIGETYFS